MTKKLKRVLKVIGLVVVGMVVIGAIWWPRAVQASFPQIDGEIKLTGLDAPVDVYRDAQGIPHIYASTEHDLFYAQGFVEAQDRFWQMDMNRHASAGRVSELLGSATIETDVFLRTLGWERVAKQELEMLDEQTLNDLQSYADGVNEYIGGKSGSELSLEYTFLPLLNRGYTPEPWQPLNTLTWAKAMAWDLGKGKLNVEIDRAILLSSISKQQLDDLFPAYPTDKPFIVNDQTPFTGENASAS
ncbi:MAG: penicillin acylase family protein, partial [Chloroflexota bacterium]